MNAVHQTEQTLVRRLWERQPNNVALKKLRGLTKRERSYDGKLTEPAGSRFHPERAEIWVEEGVL